MGSGDLHRFRSWLRAFEGTWTHIRVSGIAHRVGTQWHNRCGAIVLADSPECPLRAPVQTDHVFAFQTALPVNRLARVFRAIRRGGLAAEDLPGLPLAVFLGAGAARYRLSGCRVENDTMSSGDAGAPPSLRLSWRGGQSFAELFPARDAWDRWREAESLVRGRGYGKIADLARHLDIPVSDGELRPDGLPFLEVIAPLPVHLHAAYQSPDRTCVEVDLDVGARANRDGVRVIVETDELPLPYPHVDLGRQHEGVQVRLRLPIPAPGDFSQAEVVLLYRSRQAQTMTIVLWPRLERSTRLSALSWMDGEGDRLEHDLGLAAAPNETLDAFAFERGFGHLLMLLGFSPAWWPKRSKDGRRSARIQDRPNPDDNPDLLAFSASDAHALVVECSVGTPAREKVEKLARRAELLARHLTKQVGGYNPVDVIAILALARGDVPATTRSLVQEKQVTVVDEKRIALLVRGLKAGAQHRELVELMPSTLRSAFAAPRQSVW